MLVGRSINCPMGVAHRLVEAKDRGAKVIFVNPWQPDPALGTADWIPVVPGTDDGHPITKAELTGTDSDADKALYAMRYIPQHGRRDAGERG